MNNDFDIYALHHTKLIDQDMNILFLRQEIENRDIHKSIAMYTIKILNEEQFKNNSGKYLKNLEDKFEKHKKISEQKNNECKKYMGAYLLLQKIINKTNKAYQN